MTNYLDELNESQRNAVLYNEGPSLVIAGAGSGKTRVLTYKIAYLLEQGYTPWSILALTFTNKAAREMKERIGRQVGEQARYLWMGTFHSIFSRILRTEAQTLGFTSSFTIYDSADSKSLIKSILKEMQLDEKTYKPASVLSRISNAKNHLVLPDAYASNPEIYQNDLSAKMPALRDIYRHYWERCRQSGAMDFDDLLVYTYLLFQDHPDIRRKYAEQFRYVLVDEYQDTNFAQHSIVLQLTREHQRVCVVGDDAQSIYSFRGANIENILKFTQTYKGVKLFKLEQNYRSTQTIVCAANSLIEKNSEQIRKEVFSEKAKGEPIQVFSAYSDVEEGEIVANYISKLRAREHYVYSDFAILYRTNAQSRIFEEALRKRGLPYKIYGGLSFYQRKEIKDVIAYFRLVVNPHDEEALKRVINYPARGIGDTTLAKLIRAAAEAQVSVWTVLKEPLTYGLNLNKGTHTKLQDFRALIEGLVEESLRQPAYELGTLVVRQSGIMNEIYQSTDPENLSRQENIEELINGMHDFCATRQEEGNEHVSLADFLSEVSLLTDLDTDQGGDTEQITLMTIHSAKGLEFKNVFVVGLEENLFPGAQSMDSYKALEEERRLFYVAITRAEEHCCLSFARSRFKYGKMEFSSPSRFLRDIDAHFLHLPEEERISRMANERADCFRREQRTAASGSLFGDSASAPLYGRASTAPSATQATRTFRTPASEADASRPSVRPSVASRHLTRMNEATAARPAPVGGAASPSDIQVGQVIEHERFGIGDVLNVEGTGDNRKATVRFRNAGEKQLLLKFARFKLHTP